MKYIMYNDSNYLLKSKKNIFIIFFIIVTLSLLINIDSSNNIVDILVLSFGYNIKFEQYGVLEIIMYLFNLFLFLYLIVDVYIKDLLYNIENIFLRIKPIKYIIIKSINFILMVLIIKLIEYLYCIIIGILFNKAINYDIIKLYFIDSTYIIICQFLFITVFYIFYVLLQKKTTLFSFVLLFLFLVIPKNVLEIQNHLVLALIILIFSQIALLLIFNKKSKKIIESL